MTLDEPTSPTYDVDELDDWAESELALELDLYGAPQGYQAPVLVSQLDGITHAHYDQLRSRVFGTSNPHLFTESEQPYWYAMTRSCHDAWGGARALAERWGKDLPADFSQDSPRYCQKRFGQTRTVLPDGTIVRIAGEHEDSYDPDFCIYNDVLVIHPHPSSSDGTEQGCRPLSLYGYPRSIFPPTDFHTSTLVGDKIWIIGNLGYGTERRVGETQVLQLDVQTFAILPIETSGDNPGWLSKHTARLVGDEIIVNSGQIQVDDQRELQKLAGEYGLNLVSRQWRQIL
ncbi:hypothetical protein BKA62DRAFT_695942 [Auriculariales sp. MPI-PUGE-AT-0066]|nr:hypothetical protein BKA62DRAFT_695942 [Auriculariales sp. MPI-PUGE-AT-0066]